MTTMQELRLREVEIRSMKAAIDGLMKAQDGLDAAIERLQMVVPEWVLEEGK